MNLKPAIHPFDFSLNSPGGKTKDRRVSFAAGLSKYPSEKQFPRSKTILNSDTQLPV